MKTKKITLATVKSFIKKNIGNIYIDVKSEFSGMIDGLEFNNDGFFKALDSDGNNNHTLGIQGAWFVGSSRDYFDAFENDTLTGIKVVNACGSFILAIKK